MNSTELLDAFRVDTQDTRLPYFWSDEEVFRYLNDAYFQFVRRTGGVADFDSEACEIVVVAGEPVSEMHPSVLRVMNAWRGSDSVPLEIVNLANLLRPPRLEAAQPRRMILGMRRGSVHWDATPVADDLVQMHVYRLPLLPITEEGQTLDDVDELHHLRLIDWMRYLAYLKKDAEALSPQESDRSAQAFLVYCDQVRAENERYKHKTRVVRYGGL